MLDSRESNSGRGAEQGVALVIALLVLVVLSSLIVAYSVVALNESKLSNASLDGIQGQMAAEAGVNLRCAAIREQFQAWEKPVGTPPATPADGELPCTVATGTGSGDFRCITYDFADRSAVTYVREEAGNPRGIIVPPGEPYEGMSAEEWRYTVSSTSVSPNGFPENIQELRWKTRNVPVFQMFALYDRDLEWNPGSDMTVHGRVHSNEDLYLDPGNDLDIYDSGISISGRLMVGRKWSSAKCQNGDSNVDSNSAPSSPIGPPAGANDLLITIPNCSAGRREITQAELDSLGLGDTVQSHVDPLEIPPVEDFDPPKPISAGTSTTTAAGLYWENADLRVVLTLRDLNGDGDTTDYAVDNVSESTYGVDFNYDGDTGDIVDDMREMWVEVRNPDNSVDVVATGRLTDPRQCPGIFNTSPNTNAANKPVGPLGGTRPSTIYYTSEQTFSDNNWKWKDSAGTPKRLGLKDWREYWNFGNSYAWITMLQVDMDRIWDCLHDADMDGEDILYQGRHLDDDTNGGLVFYFSVDGPDSTSNRSTYGVRLFNGSRLHSTTSSVPRPIGLTIVTDHAAYIQGNFNTVDWIPAAVMSDTVSILSTAWSDDPDSTLSSRTSRPASNTAINAAFLSGQVVGLDDLDCSPAPCANGAGDQGGLVVYPRFVESWSGVTITLNTSFVSLFAPRHNRSFWANDAYQAPVRVWDFDQRFAQGQLPPMTPRFTYSRQEYSTRNFDW